MASVNAVHAHMNQQLMVQGGRIDAVFFCPHAPADECDCRKPKPGMMKEIGRRYGVDLVNVAMVGDTLRDLQAASAAGCEPHLVRSGRAAKLEDDEVQIILDQVPAAQAHASLAAFVEFMLARHRYVDSAVGSLRT
jgi:D-glycero-D-manno-heptose 1,7-bisphosphate phosphatase